MLEYITMVLSNGLWYPPRTAHREFHAQRMVCSRPHPGGAPTTPGFVRVSMDEQWWNKGAESMIQCVARMHREEALGDFIEIIVKTIIESPNFTTTFHTE